MFQVVFTVSTFVDYPVQSLKVMHTMKSKHFYLEALFSTNHHLYNFIKIPGPLAYSPLRPHPITRFNARMSDIHPVRLIMHSIIFKIKQVYSEEYRQGAKYANSWNFSKFNQKGANFENLCQKKKRSFMHG